MIKVRKCRFLIPLHLCKEFLYGVELLFITDMGKKYHTRVLFIDILIKIQNMCLDPHLIFPGHRRLDTNIGHTVIYMMLDLDLGHINAVFRQ